MAEGVSYTIHGTKLIFPCKAYPTQLSMMDKIMKGLDCQQHCLLESPTGSGKSLALLCSCLAWQTAEYEKAKAQEEEAARKDSPATNCCDNKTTSSSGNAEFIDLTSQSPVKSLPPLQPSEVSTPSIVSKIELKPPGNQEKNSSKEEDDDFKFDKRFRTPGATKSLRTWNEDNRYENEDWNSVTKNNPPEWKMELNNKESPGACSETKSPEDSKKDKKNVEKIRVPKIYFGTRTHKQVAQITRELGKTAYRCTKMCILSSREHSCIHPKVSTGKNKNEECKKLLDNTVKGETCFYYQKASALNTQANIKRLGLTTAWDIEDLTRIGKKLRACPYYAARELMKEADIVFCPYNYLIDPKIRMQMEIDIKDQIVVLDEAHNVEDSARESASLTINAVDLQETLDDIDKMISWRIMPNNYQSLHLMCANLKRWMTKNSDGRMKDRGFEQAVSVMSGTDILDGLREAGITPGTYAIYQNLFGEIMAADKDPDRYYEKTSPSSQSVMILEGLFLVLGYLFGNDGQFLSDYRVTIMKTAVVVRGENLPGGWKRAGFGTKKEWTYSLNFWCFNPAVVFSQIGSQARSIILTSGTLSPMSSFASELGVPFSIKLEANHVIANSQVWVGTLSCGPSNSSINASYRFSETFSFQDDIGNLLLEVCEKVPHGVLCFFPSYNMLEKVSRRWQSTGLWSKLLQKKLVLSEPRSGGKSDFDDVMHEFYQAIRRSEGEEDEGVDSDDDDYCVNSGGALFLAVCRGKVSEGLDFADNNARAVITVGIPFPNTKDLKVDLKRKYNDEYAAKRGLLNGNEWYEIQAFRALNQALGRCIRHKQDWGAILLVDERFTKTPRYSNSISKWVRQRIQHFRNFDQAIGSLKDFADARQLMPCPATQTPKSATKITSSSATDGSFHSDTSPNREEPVTPCVSTPLAPKNDFNSTLSNPLETPGHQNTDDLSKHLISTPVSHLKQEGLANPPGFNESLRPIVKVDSPVTNTVANQVLLNIQQKNLTIPTQQNVPVVTNVNPQLPQRFVFIPTNALGVPRNVNPSIINAASTIRATNSPNVLRANTPMVANRPQQVLFVTPIQFNNQNIRVQRPGAGLVYTSPKTILFTPSRNGPTQGTQNLSVTVPQAKGQSVQGKLFNREDIPSTQASRPSANIELVQSKQENFTKEKGVIKSNELCSRENKFVSDQIDAKSSRCNANVSYEQTSGNERITESNSFVDRKKSAQETTLGFEEECTKQPLNANDANEVLNLKQLNNKEPIENIVHKMDDKVNIIEQNEIEMRDMEFPESPEMFSTPSPQTDVVKNCENNGKEHDSKADDAEKKSDIIVNDRPNNKESMQDAVPVSQVNTSGLLSDVDQNCDEVSEEIPSCVAQELPTKDLDDLKAAIEVREEGFDCEQENTMTSKKMRVDSNGISLRTRTSRRIANKGDPNLKDEQEKEKTVTARENPDEKTPLKRNLRRAAQKQGLARPVQAIEIKRDVKGDKSEEPSGTSTSTILFCKQCNNQVFKGVVTQQTIHSQNLTNLYDKYSTLKTRSNKKRKREDSVDRIVWTADKTDVSSNVGLMVEPDKVPSQQGDVLNALYVPSEDHVYVPLQCTGCMVAVIGVQVLLLSPAHSSTTNTIPRQVYFFNEAICLSS